MKSKGSKTANRKVTAMEAASVLNVSREQVFTLSRNGVIRRAGYFKRNGKNVTLFNRRDVLAEAARRKASAGDTHKVLREIAEELCVPGTARRRRSLWHRLVSYLRWW